MKILQPKEILIDIKVTDLCILQPGDTFVFVNDLNFNINDSSQNLLINHLMENRADIYMRGYANDTGVIRATNLSDGVVVASNSSMKVVPVTCVFYPVSIGINM